MKDNEVLDLRTYEDYVDLGKVNTKRYLMLSELIDNSISSFDTEYGEGKWKRKLDVKITIDNEIEETTDFHGIEYFPNSKIIVSDNAFGIIESKLSDALRLNKKNNDKTSKMNVHGRGLKQSAFYFGLGVEVISKHKNSSETYFVDNKPIIKGLMNDVKYATKVSKEKREQGTTIVIDSLRKAHRFTQARLDEVIEALGYRYAKLISAEKMTINLKYKIDKMSGFDELDIKDAPDDVSRIQEDFDYSLVIRKKITAIATSKVKELIKKSTENRHVHKYPALAERTMKKLAELINSKDKNTKFLWEEEISINDEESVMMKFWLISRKLEAKEEGSSIMKRGYSIKRGIRVNEGDRSILHPPIIANEVSTYLDPLPTSNRSGAVDNRFAGEVNIADFSAQTTTDKSTFEFKSQEDKERFDNQISVIFDVFEQFVLQGRSSNKNSAAAQLTEEDGDKLESTILAKFRDIVKSIKFDNDKRNSLTAIIEFGGNEFDVKIKINDKATPTDILRVEVNEEKLLVKATWFNNHNIWKNINENKNFNVEAMIPVFLLLVLQEMQFEKKVSAIKDFSKKMKEDISPTKNINEMSKGIK